MNIFFIIYLFIYKNYVHFLVCITTLLNLLMWWKILILKISGGHDIYKYTRKIYWAFQYLYAYLKTPWKGIVTIYVWGEIWLGAIFKIEGYRWMKGKCWRREGYGWKEIKDRFQCHNTIVRWFWLLEILIVYCLLLLMLLIF